MNIVVPEIEAKQHPNGTPKTPKKKGTQHVLLSPCILWSEREDSNLRPLVPQTSALPDCATFRKFDPFYHGVEKLSINGRQEMYLATLFFLADFLRLKVLFLLLSGSLLRLFLLQQQSLDLARKDIFLHRIWYSPAHAGVS